MKNNICRERHGRRCLLSSHHNMWGKYVTQLFKESSRHTWYDAVKQRSSPNRAFPQPLSLPSNQLGCIHSHSLFERARMPLVLAGPRSAGLRPALPCQRVSTSATCISSLSATCCASPVIEMGASMFLLSWQLEMLICDLRLVFNQVPLHFCSILNG